MKTAISIPDAIFEAAERTARELGMSRSELYTRAVEQYVESHGSEGVTLRLDRVYGADLPPASTALPGIIPAEVREDW